MISEILNSETCQNLFVCPVCKSKLNCKIFEMDKQTGYDGIFTCDNCLKWFPIIQDIPRFLLGKLRPNYSEFIKKWSTMLPSPILSNIEEISVYDSAMQIKQTFAYKWLKQKWWGMQGSTAKFFEEWLLPRYGWNSKEEYKKSFFDKKICLDAGCGLGREAIRMAEANPDMLVIGIELSECIDEAYKHAKNKGINNILFIQADINNPPIAENTVDFIISEGVLHHTQNTKNALIALVSLLTKNGEIGFYVYRKKAVLREFTDDYIREKISNLPPEKAWKELESVTKLGKALSELNAKLTIEEDINLLGIKAGEYDLQRFIYYNIFKCFWNPNFTFEENVHVNFDWYMPKYAWRHTEEEIRQWIDELNLKLIWEKVEESGITVRAKKVEN